jgi:hypothetical protein
MALNAACVFEIRTTGSDSNGGGFNSGASGTDRSQQNGAFATLAATSLVHSTTTQINVLLASYTVVAADVGNIFQLAGGTATAGFYEITAVDVPNNRWTMDRSVGVAAQTCPGIMGGALLSLGKAGAIAFANGNKIWIKSGTYSITTASTNVTAGCYSNTSTGVTIEGYDTTRGDLGTKPLLQASGITAFTLISITANVACRIINIKVDGISAANGRGITFRSIIQNCEGVNFSNSAFACGLSTELGLCLNCTVTGGSGATQAAFLDSNCFGCVAYDNACPGFVTTAPRTFCYCIADSNTGISSDGFGSTGASAANSIFLNCVAYNNGRDGFRLAAVRGGACINCIAEDNTTFGFNGVNVNGLVYHNCAGFSNTSGESTFGTGTNNSSYNFVTGASSFFTNAAGRDFSLNNTASAGASARAAGIPGVYVSSFGTTGYLDIGAAQHQDSGAAASALSAAYLG